MNKSKNPIVEWIKTRKIAGLIWLMIWAGWWSFVVTLSYHYIFIRNHWNTLPEDVATKNLKDPADFFKLIATWMFFQAMLLYMQSKSAIMIRDEAAFKKEYYKQVSPVLDGIMSVLGFYIMWIKMRTYHADPLEGYDDVFKNFFIMIALRSFSMGLYDPASSILYEKEIPPEYLKSIEDEKAKK